MEMLKSSLVSRDPGGGGRIKKKITGDLGGSETILSDPVMVDTCHCTFVKTHRTYNTKSEL